MAKTFVLAVLWVTVLWRSPAIREAGAKRTMWLALTCLAAALTFDLPAVIAATDTAFHSADLATLFKHLLGVGACVALIDWTIATTKPARLHWHVRRRHEITAVVVIALSVLFFRTPRVETSDFSASAAGNAWAIGYLLTFELFLAFAMLLGAQMFAAAWPGARSRLLRNGLISLTLGTVLGLIYATTRSAVLIVSLLMRSPSDGTRAATSITDDLQAGAVAFMLLGLALPACETGWRAVRNIHHVLYLRPLWLEVTQAIPDVLLFPPPTLREDLTGVRLLGLRLVRASVEIRDAARQLNMYLSSEQTQHVRERLAAAGLSGDDLKTFVEACLIGAGLRAKKLGLPLRESQISLEPTDAGIAFDEELSWTDDLRWLRKVAAARRSTLVRRIEEDVVPSYGSSGSAQLGWATS
jgi:Family of unknown function (DUF6545)